MLAKMLQPTVLIIAFSTWPSTVIDQNGCLHIHRVTGYRTVHLYWQVQTSLRFFESLTGQLLCQASTRSISLNCILDEIELDSFFRAKLKRKRRYIDNCR